MNEDIIMNEIATLIRNYDSFMKDLGQLNKDIYEILKNYDIEWQYEYWSPRDRYGWTVKKLFTSKYQNEKEVFYVGYNLENDCPYLLLEKMYDLKNYTPGDFTDNDGFYHLLNSDIQKTKDENNIGFFESDWGKCIFAKISLLEITSQDIVNTDVKAVIDYIFKKGKISLKTIKLL